MVDVSASVNLPLHHKVQKFSSGTGPRGWSRKKDRKTGVVVVCWQGFGRPHDIAVSGDGRHIYVAEIGPNVVWQFINYDNGKCLFIKCANGK